jgi:predicted nucleotidyltransferase
MRTGLPRWLMGAYGTLLLHFGFLPFAVAQAKQVLASGRLASSILFRLRERGWAERFGPRQYRLVHPIVATMHSAGNRWKASIQDALRLPVCELAVARLIEELGPRLRSLVIFGSLARNRTTKESDIDIFVVASGLPREYSRRVRLLNSIVRTAPLEAWLGLLWEKEGILPLVDVLAIAPEELDVRQPFFLDMVDGAIIVLDKGGFMERKIEELRGALYDSGARRIALPDGTHYWLLPSPG